MAVCVLDLHNMGYKYHLQGRLWESIEAYEQCLELRGSVHSDGDLRVTTSTMIQCYEVTWL